MAEILDLASNANDKCGQVLIIVKLHKYTENFQNQIILVDWLSKNCSVFEPFLVVEIWSFLICFERFAVFDVQLTFLHWLLVYCSHYRGCSRIFSNSMWFYNHWSQILKESLYANSYLLPDSWLSFRSLWCKLC